MQAVCNTHSDFHMGKTDIYISIYMYVYIYPHTRVSSCPGLISVALVKNKRTREQMMSPQCSFLFVMYKYTYVYLHVCIYIYIHVHIYLDVKWIITNC